MSARLAEFSAYYSNRLSYDEVAGLLERVTGQHVLSDQTIQHLVVAKAVEVSQQWQSESQADTAAPPLPAVNIPAASGGAFRRKVSVMLGESVPQTP
jgi:hypothetical protein